MLGRIQRRPNQTVRSRCQRAIVNLTIESATGFSSRSPPTLALGTLLDRRSPVDDQLPVKPVELLVLLMLSAGDRHGYGIRQDIIDHTHGAIELEAGNLYRTIRRLEADGFIDESGPRPAGSDDDERRRYYRLTPFGRRVLAAELERLRALVQLGEARHLIEPLHA